MLHAADQSFPLFAWQDRDFAVVTEQIGAGYGKVTRQAQEALNILKEREHIILEGTYTAKAFAAVLSDLGAGKLVGKKVLFWSTYSIGDFADLTRTVNYRSLPVGLHEYFA